MAEQSRPDNLAQLRATVTTLQAELAAQRTVTDALRARPQRSRRRLPRRILPLALVALLVALTPLALLAASPFNDLTGGVHDANIGLIYDAGITKGCVPNVSYCPTANVTREEMASFLARTAGLGANSPVVNAKTAQTADQATNATNAVNATTATNATTVGGFAPSALTRIAFTSSQGDTNIPAGGNVNVLTVSLTVPTQSYVLVTYSGTAFASSTTNCPCGIQGRLAQDGDVPILDVAVNVATTATDIVAGFDRRQIAGAQVFLATPGTHTYTFSASRFFGTSTGIGIAAPRLQAQLIPFANSGAGATELTPPGESGTGSSSSTAP